MKSLQNEANSLKSQNKAYDTYGAQSSTAIGSEKGLKVADVTIGVSAYKYDWYLLSKNNNIFIIKVIKRLGEGPVIDITNLIPEAETILSTFKFTK